MRAFICLFSLAIASASLSGCLAASAVGAVVGAAGAVIPDGDKEK